MVCVSLMLACGVWFGQVGVSFDLRFGWGFWFWVALFAVWCLVGFLAIWFWGLDSFDCVLCEFVFWYFGFRLWCVFDLVVVIVDLSFLLEFPFLVCFWFEWVGLCLFLASWFWVVGFDVSVYCFLNDLCWFLDSMLNCVGELLILVFGYFACLDLGYLVWLFWF